MLVSSERVSERVRERTKRALLACIALDGREEGWARQRGQPASERLSVCLVDWLAGWLGWAGLTGWLLPSCCPVCLSADRSTYLLICIYLHLHTHLSLQVYLSISISCLLPYLHICSSTYLPAASARSIPYPTLPDLTLPDLILTVRYIL